MTWIKFLLSLKPFPDFKYYWNTLFYSRRGYFYLTLLQPAPAALTQVNHWLQQRRERLQGFTNSISVTSQVKQDTFSRFKTVENILKTNSYQNQMSAFCRSPVSSGYPTGCAALQHWASSRIWDISAVNVIECKKSHYKNWLLQQNEISSNSVTHPT